ncbi:permease [Merdimonas faecis]|uniref:permease n=1 Tax=Merdimonas faecis TaxID=1653435 RepID=UPI0023F66735|nr:permease [Merdimonas faecis]
MLLFLQILFGVLAAGTGIGLIADIAKNRMEDLKKATGKQWASGFAVGIVANFLDTLGCGSYAPSTFMYKLFNQIDDINIPGTLNVGDTFPVIFEAFIFTASVDVDPVFLLIMYVCAAAGSFGFATIVTKWPRNKIRWALGIIMIPLAIIMLCRNTGWGPFGMIGTATTLTGWKLIVAAGLNILWGALMDIGFGLYAPCMATCLLLGIDATAAFPVFMGSCACLMPACSIEFIKTKRYDVPHTVGNAIGGCVGVFLAWKVVTTLPMFWLINLVCVVLLWTSYTLISAALKDKKAGVA